MWYLIPFELQVFCGGWRPSARFNPKPKDDAPARDSDLWDEYRRREYGRHHLKALLKHRRTNGGRRDLEAGLAHTYQCPVTNLIATVTDGGMRGEMCPLLRINLHLTRVEAGPPLLMVTTRYEVERFGIWLIDQHGAGWVTAHQMLKNIAVDLP